MESPKKHSALRSAVEKGTIILFLTLLWLPTLDVFVHIDHARFTFENRAPAKWPKWTSIEKIQDFVGGIETYFNDHFGFRKQLVRWNNHWKDQLFGISPAEAIAGQDGWYFYSGAHFFENYTGMSRFKEPELAKWRELLEQRQAWCKARGIKYMFVIPPDKHTIYPEYLPTWIHRAKEPSKVEQFVAYMKTNSTVPVFDLSKPIIEAKPLGPLYRKTDTHWNAKGAWVAYRDIIETLRGRITNSTPISLDAYNWSLPPSTNGDLTRLMGRGEIVETTAYQIEPLKRMPSMEERTDPKRFPYTGSPETMPVYTSNPSASQKVVVFHDSFAAAWYPFLGLHFHEAIYLWQYDWDFRLLEREKPDVIIDEMLERIFCTLEARYLLEKDQKSISGKN
jgi:alginate O-acetyltransferase complex protein AlgJ